MLALVISACVIAGIAGITGIGLIVAFVYGNEQTLRKFSLVAAVMLIVSCLVISLSSYTMLQGQHVIEVKDRLIRALERNLGN